MSNKPHHEVRSRGEAYRILAFNFLCNDSDDPDPGTIVGDGVVSITHTGSHGEFEITLDDTYPKALSIHVDKNGDDSPSGDVPSFEVNETIATDGKLTVQYCEAGAGVDRLAADNVKIAVTILAQNRVL